MGYSSNLARAKEVPGEEAPVVEVERVIYPHLDRSIIEELKARGIRKVLSYGPLELPNGVRVLGKGKTGIVVLTEDLKALKIRRADSPKETLEIEAKIQARAEGVAPKVFDFGRNFILMEYVNGRHISRDDVDVLPKLVEKAHELDLRGIQHDELVRPWKNVLRDEGGNVYILDYDDASIRPNPRNVTSVLTAFGLVDLAKEYSRVKDIKYVLERLSRFFHA
jgi:putative serine/threonine protein kinase